jgi:hypothetical protein
LEAGTSCNHYQIHSIVSDVYVFRLPFVKYAVAKFGCFASLLDFFKEKYSLIGVLKAHRMDIDLRTWNFIAAVYDEPD